MPGNGLEPMSRKMAAAYAAAEAQKEKQAEKKRQAAQDRRDTVRLWLDVCALVISVLALALSCYAVFR